MDDWGDPWADDAAKTAADIHTSKGVTGASVLAGFGDEAQWGAVDDEAVWSRDDTAVAQSASGEEGVQDKGLELADIGDDVSKTPLEGESEDGVFEDVAKEDSQSSEEPVLDEPVPSFEVAEQSPPAADFDSSDSGTTIEPDHASREAPETVASPGTTPESVRSGVSTRPSTSLSESSHLDESTESLRTSFEDEHRLDKGHETADGRAEDDVREAVQPVDGADDTKETDDEFGDFEEEVMDDEQEGQDVEDGAEKNEVEHVSPTPSSQRISASPAMDAHSAELSDDDTMNRPDASFNPDHGLIATLFPMPEPLEEAEREPEPVISSTSTRKAWYRITRKETMREFESGNGGDNHVRIGWRTSTIRAETNKIVSRWASEDRINGRVMLGGKPGAVFGWDNPGSTLSPSFAKHRRTATSTAVGQTVKKVADVAEKPRPQSLALAAVRKTSVTGPNPIAQFNWSTSPTAERIPLPDTPAPSSNRASFPGITSPRIASEEIAQKPVPPAIARASRPPRPTSMILPKTRPAHTSHARSSSGSGLPKPPDTPTVDEIFASFEQKWGSPSPVTAETQVKASPPTIPVASLPSPKPLESPAPTSASQTQRPPPINTAIPTASSATIDNNDDDDDFGEMVASPAVSAPPAVPNLNSPPLVPSPAPRTATFPYTPSPLNPIRSPSIALTSQPPRPLSTPVGPALQALPKTSNDAWASADFSIFEAPAPASARLPPTRSTFSPVGRAIGHTRNTSLPTWSVGKPLVPTPFQKPQIGHHRSQSLANSVDDDAVVTGLVDGLPDLGYMLR